MTKKILPLIYLASLFCLNGLAQSSNDDCANATSLTLGSSCTTTSFTFTANTLQGTVNPALCNGATTNRDGWYTFTTGASTTSIELEATTNRPWAVAIYSGNCSGFTQVACDNASAGNSITLNAITVSPSTTYYIRISRTNGGTNAWTGNVCVYNTPPPPSNDDPCNAISLSVAASCSYSTYTTLGATASSGIPAPGCASYSGGDIWFTATVPNSGAIEIDTQSGPVMSDSGMAIYSGTCGSLTLIECDDDDSPDGYMSYIYRSGLSPGSTIYIRVWEYGNDENGTFGICVTEPPMTVPSSGNNSYTTCSGTLYDNGGSSGNYVNSSNGYTVLNPSTPGDFVQVSGSVTAEAGYDYLTIYDGTGTGGTILWEDLQVEQVLLA